jgi:RNA polymerase sigma-70 factor (ECF subfamily)
VDSETGSPAAKQRRLLDLARQGDEDAFRELMEPHRAQLRAHCYRMLGSIQDAEDASQDALLRSWRGLLGFQADKPLRPWLYRIATNVCLDAIARRPERTLPLEHGPPARPDDGPGAPVPETVWVEPYPDDALGLEDGYAAPDARYEQRESVELAFIVAVQHLPALQRAVLLLRDVLGFSAREVADALDTTVASVNSALQRARKPLRAKLPARTQQATLRSLGDRDVRELVQRYVDAWASRDIDTIVSLLVEEATFAMPPHPHWFDGRDAVIAFITSTGRPRLRHVIGRASGQPAIGWYLWDPQASNYAATSLEVLTLDGARVRHITAFVAPALFSRFDMPPTLEVDGRD